MDYYRPCLDHNGSEEERYGARKGGEQGRYGDHTGNEQERSGGLAGVSDFVSLNCAFFVPIVGSERVSVYVVGGRMGKLR